MILAGSPFSHEIQFSTGLPVGAIVYSLLGNNGLPMAGYTNVPVTPAVGALSYLIIIPSAANTVATDLFENRTLTWTYTTATGTVNGSEAYRVQKAIPFGVSVEGVRRKLGAEPREVPDDRIDLLRAYSDFISSYAAGAFTAYVTSGDRNTLLVIDAIEAIAGLSIIPWLQMTVAKKEDSGTNSYERFSSIDWDRLITSLTSYITPVNDLVDPIVDITVLPVIFVTAKRTDVITGEEP